MRLVPGGGSRQCAGCALSQSVCCERVILRTPPRGMLATVVGSTERVIRYVCTCRAHVHAPATAGYAMRYGFAWAWCPSTKVTDHEWTQIKDMRSRMADLADVLDALRRTSTGWSAARD